MQEIEELIRQFGLQEDEEHVIIPYTDKNGIKKRRFILKRPFIRVMYGEEYFVDYPLAEVIMSAVKYPELSVIEALYMMNREKGEVAPDVYTDESKVADQ